MNTGIGAGIRRKVVSRDIHLPFFLDQIPIVSPRTSDSISTLLAKAKSGSVESEKRKDQPEKPGRRRARNHAVDAFIMISSSRHSQLIVRHRRVLFFVRCYNRAVSTSNNAVYSAFFSIARSYREFACPGSQPAARPACRKRRPRTKWRKSTWLSFFVSLPSDEIF